MNELLQSIKADLLSRHMLAVLAVAGVALVGALAYAVLGSGSGSKPPALTPAAPLPTGLPVAVAPPNTTTQAASETPAGVPYQTQGSTRNPFTPLPGSPLASAASAGGAGSSSTSGSHSSGSSAGGSSGSSGLPSVSPGSSSPPPIPASPTPTPAPAPSPQPSHKAPALKVETLSFYSVSALFGLAPANAGEQPTLTPYEDMRPDELLPNKKSTRIVFIGVVEDKKVKRAVFGLIVPPILRGEAVCFPSDTHCEAIELQAGKSEELEYVQPDGQTIAFELKVVKIAKRSAPASAAAAKRLRASQAGLRVLRQAGLSGLL